MCYFKSMKAACPQNPSNNYHYNAKTTMLHGRMPCHPMTNYHHPLLSCPVSFQTNLLEHRILYHSCFTLHSLLPLFIFHRHQQIFVFQSPKLELKNKKKERNKTKQNCGKQTFAQSITIYYSSHTALLYVTKVKIGLEVKNS